MLRAERPPDERVVIARARERLARLRVTLSDVPDADIREATFGTHADPAHLTAVRAALHHRRKVRIRYQRANGPSARRSESGGVGKRGAVRCEAGGARRTK